MFTFLKQEILVNTIWSMFFHEGSEALIMWVHLAFLIKTVLEDILVNQRAIQHTTNYVTWKFCAEIKMSQCQYWKIIKQSYLWGKLNLISSTGKVTKVLTLKTENWLDWIGLEIW